MSTYFSPSRRSAHERARLSAPFHPARSSNLNDDGFSIAEMLVTMFILSIILVLAFGFMTNLLQQSTNVRDTMSGLRQDQLAGEGLLQFLHSTIAVLPGSNASTLKASILAGVNSSTSTPQTATFQALLTNPGGPKLDATFSTSITANGGTGSTSTVQDFDAMSPESVANVTTVSNSTVATVASGGFPGVLGGMDVSGPGVAAGTTVASVAHNTLTLSTAATAGGTATLSFGTPFVYYYNNSSVSPPVLATTTTPTNAQLAEVVAVAINVTFLSGPHVPTEGFQAVRPSTFQTTVYLQNAAGAPAPTSTTSVVGSTPAVAGSPVTLTATVAPVPTAPDAGLITFTVTLNGTVQAVCTSPVAVSTTSGPTDGTASCTFTPSTAGNYSVEADFSGTDTLQPSTGTTTVSVVSQTTTSISVTETSQTVHHSTQYTLNVTATVSPSTATGNVTFTLNVSCPGHNCTTYNGSGTLSSGSTSWSLSGLSGGNSYSVFATYAGDANDGGSTSATTNGTT